MKRLLLLRGLPGSGKSTLATLLVELGCRGVGNSAVFYEADDYFVDDEGNYKFDATKLRAAHHECQSNAWDAMASDVPLVVVSNTFSQNWELRHYEELAAHYGYQVTVLTVEGGLTNDDLTARNEHGCPVEKIAEMRGRWEDYIAPRYDIKEEKK